MTFDEKITALLAKMDAIDQRIAALETRTRVAIQEKAERESRFADLFAGLTPEPILVDHWFPDPEPEAPWEEEDDESDLMIINIQP